MDRHYDDLSGYSPFCKEHDCPSMALWLPNRTMQPHTVAGYVKPVYRKLNISSRAEAAVEAVRRGLV